MSEARIDKFGIIKENEKGKLVFEYFIIDGGDRFDRTDVAILTLCKERIEEELEALKMKNQPSK